MSPRSVIVEQFRKPSGPLGALAGWIMASRQSNLERNRWTMSLLGIEEGDRVLEVGFGPGAAIAMAAAMVGPTGRVTGVDHSNVMLAQAKRRNRTLIKQKRVDLMLLSLDEIDRLSGPFDSVFSSNVLQFQTDKRVFLRSALRLMRPGARLATTFQPRALGAAARDAAAFAADLEHSLTEEGYVNAATQTLPLSPAPAICVMAEVPAERQLVPDLEQ